MTSTEKIDLYVANNLEELNQRADNNPSLEKAKTASCAQITNFIETTWTEAKKAEQSRDEERAYILYMRLYACFNLLIKAKDVATNKVIEFAGCISNHCLSRVLYSIIKRERLFGWKKRMNYRLV